MLDNILRSVVEYYDQGGAYTQEVDMDIQIKEMVQEAQERGWDASFSTCYEVQERSVNGDSWYSLGRFASLGDATACRMRHFDKWYSRVFESVDDVDSLRIVMRHMVEVIL